MALGTRTLSRYAALGTPLAFVGLPIYVHLPKFYGDLQNMNLALLGVILLSIRLLDCIFDPVIGWLRDRYPSYRRLTLRFALPLLVTGYALLFHPPSMAGSGMLALWLSASLVLVYISYSILTIHYYASGVELAEDAHQATRVASYREAAMLVGVLLASILPPLLSAQVGANNSYHYLSLIFAILMLAGAFITLRMPLYTEHQSRPTQAIRLSAFLTCLKAARVRHILWVLLFNSIPTAITGTLFFFFCQDVLNADETQAGLFLMIYFVAAAAAIPGWSRLARRLGERQTLAIAMMLAIATFLFALTLGAGDLTLFALICLLSGAAAGADAALLPAMFAHALKQDAPAQEGIGFGLWHFTSKLTLALAAGTVLPLLAIAGYQPGGDASITVLSLAYALIPCILKLLAIVTLLLFHPDRKAQRS
jgi:GPH family glycoside/pentoside/hexuronide:cation symporter